MASASVAASPPSPGSTVRGERLPGVSPGALGKQAGGRTEPWNQGSPRPPTGAVFLSLPTSPSRDQAGVKCSEPGVCRGPQAAPPSLSQPLGSRGCREGNEKGPRAKVPPGWPARPAPLATRGYLKGLRWNETYRAAPQSPWPWRR